MDTSLSDTVELLLFDTESKCHIVELRLFGNESIIILHAVGKSLFFKEKKTKTKKTKGGNSYSKIGL